MNSGEYKLMGLAPYGDDASVRCAEFIRKIKSTLIEIFDDGSILLNMDYFNFATGQTMCHDEKWFELFNVEKRDSESEFNQEHMDLAAAIQIVTEEIVFRLASTAKKETGSANLVMAGGVALNCVANGKLLNQGIFDNIWIQPAAGDAGGALGAALAAYHIYHNQDRVPEQVHEDSMEGSYLGPAYSDIDIERVCRKYDAVAKKYYNDEDVTDTASSLLAEGKIIGWFQGRMEWGPRALGNRSILGDPRDPEMQKRLNLKIKYREGFRPFAPSVVAEDAADYFDLSSSSPYMLYVAKVKEEHLLELPSNYQELAMYDRLYNLRSIIPAITHVDCSARIQTVHKETNPKYHKLISAFKNHTGCGLVVNTSFNVRGEPIVCSPEDAYRCFMSTDMDCLVMNNYIFKKLEQPYCDDKDRWRKEFLPD